MKQLRYLLIAVLLVVMVVPVFGISSTPTFKATKTTNSPAGAGYVYGYRGGGDYANGANGQNDRLTLPAAGDWKSADNTMTVFSSEVKFQQTSPTGSNEPDGYKIMDKTANDGGSTEMALHMYFFAKPNPGYQFDGWFSNADGTGALTGSRDHYPMPGVTSGVGKVDQKKKGGPYTPSTWDNGEGLTASSGYYAAGGFYYLRNVYLFKSFDGTTVYAKFSVNPRTFTLAATGQAAVTYTATGYSGSISTSNVTTSELSSNISLNLTNPDPEQYIFEGWYWSDGKDGAQTLISESASATFSWTGNSDIVAKMNTVWIWPKVTKVVNSVADVTYNDVTTPYESWDDALTAAKAVSGATITLNQSVSDLSAVQTINKSMTIDLNGNTLTGSANNFFTITGSGVNVTITDNSPQGAGRIELINSTDATTYTVTVRSSAKLTVAGGTIYNKNENASGTARGVEAQSGTTLFVTGGHIEAQSLQNAYALINRGTTTISNGDMYAHTTSKATAVAFYNVGTSAAVNGGIFRATAATTTAYGIQQNVGKTLTISDATVDVSAVTSTAYALARSAGVIVVTGGKYNASAPTAVAASNVTNNTQIILRGGVYTIHNNLVACAASGYVRTDLVYTDPDYTAGYRYAIVNSDTEPYVCKVLASLDVFYYKSLEEAFAYVAANSSKELTIVVTSPSCTLSAGTYTVPSSTTLLLPYDVGGTISMAKAPYYYNGNGTRTRECYSKLTLENGANLKVYGKLNVNALLHNRAGGQMVANVLDSYGRLHMNAGSHIDLENGSLCSVWGFITGDGTITAKSGSLVREAFQFDFRGGTHISNTYTKAFPMCQYYVQNIEAPITFNNGATENLFTCCYASSADREGVASFIGSDGMFRMESGSTLTRRYVGSEDRIYYDLYGNSSIQDISVDVEIAEMASKEYILPINSNMTLRVHSGTTTIYYDLSLLPDSKVIIDEGASVEIKKNLYIYDKSDWRADETGYTYQDKDGNTQKSYFAVGADLNVVPFSPTKTKTRASADLTDAHVVVNGTLKALSPNGKIYTTTHGADISSEGSGKVILGVAAAGNTSFYQGVSTASKTQSIPVTAAQLHNSNDTYTSTSGAAAGDIFQCCDGTWKKGGCVTYHTITWKSEDGNTTLETDADVAEGSATSFNGSTPSKTATAQYTYTFDGWATEANGAKVHEINGTPAATANATYYAHFSQTPVSYTLTWVTDGDDLTGNYTKGTVAYGTSITAPNTPTKTGYTFAGWSPAKAETMPAAATEYTATWTINQYTLTVLSADENMGTVTGGGEYDYNTPHTITANPKQGFKFVQWNDGNENAERSVTIPAENVTYTATFDYDIANYTVKHWQQNINDNDYTEVVADRQTDMSGTIGTSTVAVANTYIGFTPKPFDQQTIAVGGLTVVNIYYDRITYTITWKDGDDATIKTDSNVKYGAMPAYDGEEPTKTATAQYTYTFNGTWSPAIGNVVGDVTYTAQFNSSLRSYDVTFDLQGHGSAIDGQNIGYDGAVAKPTDPTAEGYRFDGWYKEQGCANAWDFSADKVQGQTTLYAKWTQVFTVSWYHEKGELLRTDIVAAGETPLYGENPTKDPTDQETFTFEGWSPDVVPVTKDAEYTAQFQNHVRYYTIIWKNWDGTVLETDGEEQNMQYGIQISYDGTEPTKPSDETHDYAFKGWDPEVTPDTKVSGDQEYTAQFGVALIVGEGKSYDVSGAETPTTTTIRVSGKLNVPEGNSLTTKDLILEASAGNSGEIAGADKVTVNGNAYFDLKLNSWARHWHAFGVPWPVGSLFATKLVEIKNKAGETCHNELVLGRDYDIIHYNGATRATQGPGRHCWDYVENGDGTLTPGKAYMIAFVKPIGTIRFTKADDADITYDEDLSVTDYTGSSTDHGWNAIANPKTIHTLIDAGVDFCQVQNGDSVKSDRYTTYRLDTYKFVVGTAVYVQASGDKTVEFGDASGITNVIGFAAPRRAMAQTNSKEYIEVHLVAENNSSDRIYIGVDENKAEDVYTTGIDLAKMGVSTLHPQLWIDRYENRLAVNTMAPVNNTAIYPLSLFVPQAGAYAVSSDVAEYDNNVLYLTYDGRPIWNLNYAPCSLDLEKGTTQHYGLMLVRSKAPEVATDIDNLQGGNQPAAQKILLNGQVYILRGGVLFSITGQSVK